jgi:hypothetical protein
VTNLSFEDWLKVITTIFTIVIGFAASAIAYQQYRISKSKLRFDLYEKRLRIFTTVREFASTVAMRREFDVGQFYRDTLERYFFFDEDVCDYIEEMFEKAKLIERTTIEFAALNINNDERRQTLNQTLTQTKTWFFNQADIMVEIFSKYLSIKTLQ